MNNLKVISLLTASFTAAALCACSASEKTPDSAPETVPESADIAFDIHASVYDFGEAVDEIILHTSNLGVDAGKLKPEMFSVHVVSSSPYTDEAQLNAIEEGGLQHTGIFDEDRTVAAVSQDKGNIVLELVTANDTPGKGTLDFVANFQTFKGCNMLLDLDYTIMLNEDLPVAGEQMIAKDKVTFIRNEGILNEETAKFSPDEFDGMKYQLYTPEGADEKCPLIIWCHGGGESGYQGIIYDNVEQLKGNRGAVQFTTDEVQQIFGGKAFVLAPQTPNEWSDSDEQIKNVIDHVIENNNIDTDRIYIFGCSAGGYQVMRQIVNNPGFYAAAVATCPAIDTANIDTYGEGRRITDEQILSIETPLWLVQCTADGTVSYTESAERIYNLLKDRDVTLSAYDAVAADGIEYNTHWSWILTLRNIPENEEGMHVMEWTASQKLNQ